MLSAAALALALAALAACAPPPPASQQSAPLLRPPAISREGVLRIAVDAHYPPFASLEGSDVVGLDADVAAALAAQLGLEPKLVDVPASELGTALREKRADVALGGVPITDVEFSAVTIATSYLADGPALFSREASVSPDVLKGLRIAVQQDSPSYWLLRDKVGEQQLVAVTTLREAFIAVTSAKADAAAGDAIVGGYIGREFPALRFAGQLGDAAPLAVMISKDSTTTEQPIRDAMDRLAATGVLDAIRGKWLGELAPLKVAGSAEEGSALDTSAAPAP